MKPAREVRSPIGPRDLGESDERLAFALRAINEGVYDFDIAAGTIVYTPRLCELLHLSPDALTTPEDWLHRIHPDDRRGYERAMAAHFKGETERFEADYRYLAADGSWRWARQHGMALRGEDGRAYRLVGSAGDITEHKSAQAALELSEERYALATRAATEGIYEWDLTSGSLLMLEPSRIFAQPPAGGLTAEHWNVLVHEDDFEGYRAALLRHFRGEADHFEHEYRLRRPDGGWMWVLDRGIGVRGDGARVVRMVGAISDITERKNSESALREARDRAEAAARAKSAFLANMSHELRTPLNAIMGFTRVVQRHAGDGLDRTQRENLHKILQSAERLLGLINGVLDLSKIEAGRMDVVPERFSLRELLDDCLRSLEPLATSAGVKATTELDVALPVMTSDAEKIRQIVLNLLGNAFKFARDAEVVLRARAEGDHVVIEIADTGIGIAPEQLEAIFDEFTQLDASRTRERGGSGLGLAIARRLANVLGGGVRARSEVGVGSTFIVTLPVRAPEDATHAAGSR